MRARREGARDGAITLVGWPDAASCNRCQLRYVIGLISSSLSSPRRILQRTSKFNRKLAESSLGGEVYAFSEMADHVAPLRESPSPFVDGGAGGLRKLVDPSKEQENGQGGSSTGRGNSEGPYRLKKGLPVRAF